MKKFIIGLFVLIIVVIGGGIGYLSVADFNQYRGLIAEQVKQATGRDLVIAGDLKLNISLNPSISVSGVTFANASWGSRKEMIKMERVEAEVELIPLFSGDIRINRLVLVGLDALLETDKKGRPNWEFKTSGAPAAAKDKPSGGGEMKLPVVKKVRIENVKITYKDGRNGETIVAEIQSLDLSADGPDSPLTLKIAGAYNNVAYQAEGQLGAISGLIANKPFPIKLEAKALGATIAIDGSIKQPTAAKGLALTLSATVPNLADTLKQAAALAPALKDAGPVPAIPVSFKGTISDIKGGYQIANLALKLGTSDVSGKVVAKLGGKRPYIEADLTSTLLDIDALLPPSKKKPAAKPAAKKSGDGRVLPNDPLPFEGLKAVDAKIKFRAKKVVVQKFDITNISADLVLKNGRLELKPFGFIVSDGKISGNLLLDARNAKSAKLSTKVKVAGLDYGKLLKKTTGDAVVEGKVDVDINIRATGGSVRRLLGGLNGRVKVVSENGKINSNALNIVSADIFKAASPFSQSKGDKDLRCAILNFDIKSGKMKSKAIIIETGGISIVGKGGINLTDEKLDLKFDPRAKKTSLIKALIPFNVTGTFASPTVLPDTAAVATAAAKIAAGIATGGLSTLLEMAGSATGVIDDGIDETDYCQLALAGKPMVPMKKKSAPKPASTTTTTSTTSPPPAQKTAPTSPIDGLGDAVKGFGGALKGLFGK